MRPIHHLVRRTAQAALIAGFAATPALAHHGWGSYDAANPVTLEGPIVDAAYEYPHAEIAIEHGGESWHIILAPPSRMGRRGIPDGELVPGLTVTIEGYPSKVEDHEIRAERITLNGRTVELR